MDFVPRSRWLALLVAALLCVLGGANRGKVPAHEREGSRTADEPAALSMRRGQPRLAVAMDVVGSDASIPVPIVVALAPTTTLIAAADVAPVVRAARVPRGSVSSRGPPRTATV